MSPSISDDGDIDDDHVIRGSRVTGVVAVVGRHRRQ
jgi:hypothetical protein